MPQWNARYKEKLGSVVCQAVSGVQPQRGDVGLDPVIFLKCMKVPSFSVQFIVFFYMLIKLQSNGEGNALQTKTQYHREHDITYQL